MRDLSSQLADNTAEAKRRREANSFHVHVVFELPNKYSHFDRFVRWSKQLNDYLYLSGLEEGLHATDMARIPRYDRKKPGLIERVLRFIFPNLMRLSRMPESLKDINERAYKFFAAGLRRGIYGKPSDPNFTKVGIELRDATRNLDRWDEYVNGVGQAIEDTVWESHEPPNREDSSVIALRSAEKSDVEKLTTLGIHSELAARMIAAEPNLLVALEPFESVRYYDFRTGLYFNPDAAHAKEIVAARELFIKDLKDLADEITRLKQGKESVGAELVQAAIRMSISGWAARAKVAKLYSGVIKGGPAGK